MSDFFPIKSETVCQLKWAWSTIFLSTLRTSSCHRVENLKFDLENFNNFHNLPKKISDREMMIEGKRPMGGCEYCFKIEDAGGISDRQNHLNFTNLTPHELLNNSHKTSITPTILEVYFNNTCNLSCLYCGPMYSSVWEKEYKKFGDIKDKDRLIQENKFQQVNNYEDAVSKLWSWMEKNSKHLKKFHILGGEPFYQKEFLDCLDHFDKFPNPDCEFVIITNLMVEDRKLDFYLENLKKLVAKRKIKGLQVTCSLDCWGPQAEFIRSGLDLQQWERNFEKLLKIKWIRLQINHAVSVLSLKYMALLIDKINSWNKVRKIYIQYMTIVKPEWMNPDIFGGKLYKEDIQKIIEILPDSTEFDIGIKNYFIGISKQIGYSKPNIKQIYNLKIFLEEIDRRRNTDYKIYFPWLVEEFQKYIK